MKSIHFLPDSPYSNWYYDNCYKAKPNLEAGFYCIHKNPKFIDVTKINIISENPNFLSQIIDELNKADSYSLYINYLDYGHAQIINSIHNKSIKIFWIIWSGDLYYLPKLNFNKYDPYSKTYCDTQERINKETAVKPKYTLKQRIGRIKMMYIDRIDLNGKNFWRQIYKAIKRVNYCATSIREETNIVKENFNEKIIEIPFSIITATNGLDLNNSLEMGKDFILVGNSADPSNNHYEAILKLHNLNVSDKILLPLSYGDTQYGKNLVNDIVTFVRPEQLVVLKDFIEKTEYYSILKKVKSAVFAHNIQQAFGNIIALLALGSKVFLKKENYLYKQLKIWQIQVFSIEDDFTFENVTTSFSEEIMLSNRQIIFSLFSQDNIDKYYTDLLE